MYAATSARNASASIRRAPSRTISSISDTDPAIEPVIEAAADSSGPSDSSGTTVNTVAPSRPALLRRPLLEEPFRMIGRVRPSLILLIHRFQALLPGGKGC